MVSYGMKQLLLECTESTHFLGSQLPKLVCGPGGEEREKILSNLNQSFSFF